MVVAAGDLLEHGLVVAQLGARLSRYEKRVFDADDDLALVGRELAEDGAHQRRLAGAVGADDADAVARLQISVRSREQAPCRPSGGLPASSQLEDGLAHAPARRQTQRHRPRRAVVRRRRRRRPRRRSDRCAPSAWCCAPPARAGSSRARGARTSARACSRAALWRQPLGLLLEEARVAAVVGVELPAIELEDARGHAVEEVAIVRDQQQRAGQCAPAAPRATRRRRRRGGWSARRAPAAPGGPSSARASATRRRSPPDSVPTSASSGGSSSAAASARTSCSRSQPPSCLDARVQPRLLVERGVQLVARRARRCSPRASSARRAPRRARAALRAASRRRCARVEPRLLRHVLERQVALPRDQPARRRSSAPTMS